MPRLDKVPSAQDRITGRGRGITSERAVLTTVDQCVSSASNFAVGVVVARVAGVAGLGAYALSYAAWLLIAALHRGLVTDPMAIAGEGRPSSDLVSHLRAGLAAELALGLLSGVAIALLGVVLMLSGQRSFGESQLALAPWIPALLAQDYWRWMGFIQAAPRKALANDLVFDAVQVGGFSSLMLTRTHSVFLVISAWGFSGLVAAFAGLRQFGVRPTLRGGLSSLKAKWSIGKWIGASDFASWGVAQMYGVLTAAILGPVALGGLRAAQGLVSGPSFVLIQAGGSLGLPEASRAFQDSGWPSLRRVSRIITVAGLASVGLVLLVIIVFGRTLLGAIYGPPFERFQSLALVFAFTYVIAVLALGTILELKATGHTRPLFRVQFSALIASTVAVLVLAPLFGVLGASLAFGVGSLTLVAGQLLAGHQLANEMARTPSGVAGGVDTVNGDAPRTEEAVLPPILIATLMRGTGATGVETHLREVSAYTRSLGVPTEIVTPFSSVRWLAAAVFAPSRLIALVSTGLGLVWHRAFHYASLRLSLAVRLADSKPKLVYAQSPLAAKAALKSRSSDDQKILLAVHFQGSQADEWTDRHVLRPDGMLFRRIRGMERAYVPAVDGIVYVSDAARMALEDEIPMVADLPSTVVCNFVHDVPPLYGLGVPAADLVTVGSLEPHKNHHYLLDVLARAADMNRRYTLDIMGRGSLERSLIKHARSLGLAEQVRFLGQRPDVRAYLAGHKAYVHPSYRETGPLAVIEAMSAALPVLASPVGIIPGLLRDGCIGAIFPLDDDLLAAKVLIDLLEDTERLERMSECARVSFLRSYTTQQLAPRLVEFMRSVSIGDHQQLVWRPSFTTPNGLVDKGRPSSRRALS